MRKISKFIVITILASNSFSIIHAQEKNAVKTDSALFRGIRLEIDLFSPVMTAIGMDKGYKAQGGVYVSLKEKFFPAVEIGFGGIGNKKSFVGSDYNTKGLFAKLGMDYAISSGTKNPRNVFIVGARLGFCNFNYDITNLSVSDNYWEETQIRNYKNVNISCLWYELLAGMRVELFPRISTGWTIRMKSLFNSDNKGKPYPYYIPSLGNYKGTNWEFNYVIGYRF